MNIPDTLTQILAYGLAHRRQCCRVSGREPFPSDVVVGSAMGWLIGRQAYSLTIILNCREQGMGPFVREPVTEGISLSRAWFALRAN